MTQEALKMALQVLEDCVNSYGMKYERPAFVKAITAIKEALAQPEPFKPDWDAMAVMVEEQQRMAKRIEELEAQPEQEPVAWRTFDGEGGYDYRSYEDNESYADDWNKRNPNHSGWVDKLYTPSKPEQEPVAKYSDIVSDGGLDPRNKFDTTPPQRTWVGLTDEQIDACWNKDLWKEKQPHHIFAKAIEAKLKEKNT